MGFMKIKDFMPNMIKISQYLSNISFNFGQ